MRHLTDIIEEVKEEIAYINIKTATMKFKGLVKLVRKLQ